MVMRNNREMLGTWAVLLLPCGAVLAALWLPFGFSITGLIEEWDLLGLFVKDGPFFFVHLDGPLAARGLRPLMPLSFAIAHLLDPDSFDGWHWLTMAALLLKGGAMTYLASRATGSRAWGVVAGVLVLLYPADTMQISFRSIHIKVALAFSLVGCALLVRAFDMRSGLRAVGVALMAAMLYLVGIAIYEVAVALIALPIAVLFVRHGLGRGSWLRARLVGMTLVWGATPSLYVGYAAWISHRISSYQAQVTGDGRRLLATVHDALPELFTVGSARALVMGWTDAARMVATECASFLYLGAAVCVIALVILLTIRFDQQCNPAPHQIHLPVSWATFSFLPMSTAPGAVPLLDTSRRVAKEHAVVVAIGADGIATARPAAADHRRRLLTGDETIDRRYRRILASRSPGPVGRMFRDEFVGESYRWGFGDWWGLDVPPRGAGWREAEWIGNGFSHRSAAWKMSPTADLRFELAPAPGSYMARAEFDQIASDAVRTSMTLRVNGQPLPLRWVSPSDFEAEMPAGVLAHGWNQLGFVSDLDEKGLGLSARLDWVPIAPH